MNKSKEKSISHNFTEKSLKSKRENNVSSNKVTDENNQLTVIEK